MTQATTVEHPAEGFASKVRLGFPDPRLVEPAAPTPTPQGVRGAAVGQRRP